MGKIGRTREKLAEMLMAELGRMGVEYEPFTGADLIPVTGFWKSQDCYRWESVSLRVLSPSTGAPTVIMSISGWEAMTKIVRSGGVKIEKAYRGFPFQYEASPL